MSATESQASAPIDTQLDMATEGPRMTIWEHIGELRMRLVRIGIALLIGMIVGWTFRVDILAWLLKPYESAWVGQNLPGSPELQTLSPADVFVGYLQLSLAAAIVCSAPIIFYQLWAFISPGLYKKEKRFITPFVIFSTTLFMSGVAFAYYVVFPFTFNYFFSLLGPVGQGGTVLTQRPTLTLYLDFYTELLIACGLAFELPLFISFLIMARIVTPMQLVKFSRWAIIGSFLIGAVVTPGPEISSQIAVSGALIGLYFLSMAIAFVIRPRSRQAA